MREEFSELLGVAACLLLKNIAWYSVSKRKKKQVGSVEQIVLYPVKSCRGILVSEAEITDSGLLYRGVWDRSYVVYGAEDKRNVSLKNLLPLAEVQPELDPDRPGAIRLSCDGHPSIPVEVSASSVLLNFRGEPVRAYDCGDKVAAWLSAVCQKPSLRLAHCPDTPRNMMKKARQLDKVGGNYSVFACLAEGDGNQMTFTDKSPIMILSSASLKKVNEQLQGVHGGTDYRNFRPNIVMSATNDGDEDLWGFVYGDSFILAGAFPCERCPMVNIDHTTPKATMPEGAPVINALRPFRTQSAFRNPLFGVCCAVHSPGRVRVGESLFADA